VIYTILISFCDFPSDSEIYDTWNVSLSPYGPSSSHSKCTLPKGGATNFKVRGVGQCIGKWGGEDSVKNTKFEKGGGTRHWCSCVWPPPFPAPMVAPPLKSGPSPTSSLYAEAKACCVITFDLNNYYDLPLILHLCQFESVIEITVRPSIHSFLY